MEDSRKAGGLAIGRTSLQPLCSWGSERLAFGPGVT